MGPHGAAAGRSGGVVATGPGGAVAAGGRALVTSNGTYYRSSAALTSQGAYVRRSFGDYNAFTPKWYAQYPGAWFAAGWAAAVGQDRR